MDNRTLVKVSASEHCIGFKTVSRQRKSPRTFLVTRDELARLEQTPKIITQAIYCLAARSPLGRKRWSCLMTR